MRVAEKVRVAPWSPAASREEARAYVESRLALFAMMMFWVFWILVALLYGMYKLWPQVRPRRVDFVFECALIGQLVFGAIWYFALRRRQLSLEWLYRIDAFCLIVIGVELGNAAFQQSELPAAVYSAMIWHNFAILARTMIVPSNGTRTAVVTAVSFVPLLVGSILLGVYRQHDLDVPPAALVLGTIVYAAVAVGLASVGSSRIYGLRRQVSEAMQLGQYTTERKIGEGGMGAVYLARHAMLRRPVALKLLPPDRTDPGRYRRFEREVQHMSRLTHPNTVAIYDYGRSVDGLFYYVMEYLDGIDLERLVRTHEAQPAARVIRILAQVCGALTEAHELGLIHRDIKPGNIILCRRGGRPDIAIVVDFGLVKEVAPVEDDTRNAIAGTPAYMAPEAITAPRSVGPASDLYALGAVAYYLLTGSRVFVGETEIAVCAQHVSTPPEPPSGRTDNPIPAELERLILRCLAKDPDARPASAAAMRQELRAMAAYREWDDALAEAWWSAFDLERAAEPAPPRQTTPLTVTRDVDELDDRTESLELVIPEVGGQVAINGHDR